MSLQKISMEFYRETGFVAIKKRQLSNIYNKHRRPDEAKDLMKEFGVILGEDFDYVLDDVGWRSGMEVAKNY
jgi:hypothetical protein